MRVVPLRLVVLAGFSVAVCTAAPPVAETGGAVSGITEEQQIRNAPSGGRTVENGAAAVEQQLSSALTRWNATRDVRVLRWELLQLLTRLEDSA